MRSEAQKRADKKYNDSDKCKYTTVATRLHINQAEAIKQIANNYNITVSKYIALACKYCIDNNIQLNDDATEE